MSTKTVCQMPLGEVRLFLISLVWSDDFFRSGKRHVSAADVLQQDHTCTAASASVTSLERACNPGFVASPSSPGCILSTSGTADKVVISCAAACDYLWPYAMVLNQQAMQRHNNYTHTTLALQTEVLSTEVLTNI
jgi:hypothetical protein